jgi:CheY-like chemotaxis protein
LFRMCTIYGNLALPTAWVTSGGTVALLGVFADFQHEQQVGEKMKVEAMEPAWSTPSQVVNPPVVLLVEDESMVRQVTREVLTHAGYMVLECGSAREAVQLARQHAGRIDVLLTDVVMPGMNGADLACYLQSLQPDLITILMSGYAQSDIAQAISRTAAIHIQKPFTVNILLTRIGEALRASSVRDRLAAVPRVSA